MYPYMESQNITAIAPRLEQLARKHVSLDQLILVYKVHNGMKRVVEWQMAAGPRDVQKNKTSQVHRADSEHPRSTWFLTIFASVYINILAVLLEPPLAAHLRASPRSGWGSEAFSPVASRL